MRTPFRRIEMKMHLPLGTFPVGWFVGPLEGHLYGIDQDLRRQAEIMFALCGTGGAFNFPVSYCVNGASEPEQPPSATSALNSDAQYGFSAGEHIGIDDVFDTRYGAPTLLRPGFSRLHGVQCLAYSALSELPEVIEADSDEDYSRETSEWAEYAFLSVTSGVYCTPERWRESYVDEDTIAEDDYEAMWEELEEDVFEAILSLWMPQWVASESDTAA